jgi:hypothetical protein
MLDFSFSYVFGKRLLYVPDAIVYRLSQPLSNHLNTAIGTIADPAGYLATIGYAKNGKTKTHTLNAAGENYMFGCLGHFVAYDNM